MTLRIFVDGDPRAAGGRVLAWVRPVVEGEDVRVPVRIGADPGVVEVPHGQYLVEVLLPSGERLRASASVAAGTSDVHLAVPPSDREWLGFQQMLVPRRRLERSAGPKRLDPPAAPRVAAAVAPPGPTTWVLERWPAEWAGAGLGGLVKARGKLLLRRDARVGPSNGDGTIFKYLLPPSGAPDRIGVAVVGFGNKTVLVPVPRAWQSRSRGSVATELVVNAQRKSVATSIEDPELAPVLAYLARGSSALAAESLGDFPLELLMEKHQNPFAAAAGAYVLVDALDDAARAPRWRQWIANLSSAFRWLPDGAVLEGRALLLTDRPDQALGRFIEAFARGVPLFAEGVRMLVEGLLAFSVDEASPGDRAGLSAATEQVRHWASWLDPRESFTTFRLPISVDEESA